MKKLIQNYKATLKELRRIYLEDRTEIEKIIEDNLADLRFKLRKKDQEILGAPFSDKKVWAQKFPQAIPHLERMKDLSPLMSNLRYSIRQMGVEDRIWIQMQKKKSDEQNTIYVNPLDKWYLSRCAAGTVSKSKLNQDQLDMLNDLLAGLSPKQLEAYRLIHGQGFTYSEASDIMNAPRSTVQYYVESAQRKLSEIVYNKRVVQGSMF